MKNWFKKVACRHTFDLADLESRGSDGNVRWPCAKCGKVYVAHCGLEILSHGRPTQDKWEAAKNKLNSSCNDMEDRV